MISKKGSSKLCLSEADVVAAIQLFINHNAFTDEEKVSGIEIHRKGSKYAVSVTVKRGGNK